MSIFFNPAKKVHKRVRWRKACFLWLNFYNSQVIHKFGPSPPGVWNSLLGSNYLKALIVPCLGYVFTRVLIYRNLRVLNYMSSTCSRNQRCTGLLGINFLTPKWLDKSQPHIRQKLDHCFSSVFFDLDVKILGKRSIMIRCLKRTEKIITQYLTGVIARQNGVSWNTEWESCYYL